MQCPVPTLHETFILVLVAYFESGAKVNRNCADSELHQGKRFSIFIFAQIV